jgi:hypothetical protein
MRRLILVLAVLGLLTGFAIDVGAESITFTFVGVVDHVDDPYGVVGGNVSVGTPFTGTYTFDSDEPDADPSPTCGRYYYDNVPDEFSMTVTVGPFTFVADELDPYNFSTEIDVEDNNGMTPKDSYRVFTRELTSEEIPVSGLQMELATFENLDAITSDALLLSPPNLLLFEATNQFRVYNLVSGESDFIIAGPLTDLCVGPSSVEDRDTWSRTKRMFR